MPKKVGIIGDTGRMGVLLKKEIAQRPDLAVGLGFHRSEGQDVSEIFERIFVENDYIIDFSHVSQLNEVLKWCYLQAKPTILCTTGWLFKDYKAAIEQAAQKTCLVVAENTSFGALMQRHLVKTLARLLGNTYDIHIHEKHHRYKQDRPSGTARALISDIVEIKKNTEGICYSVNSSDEGPRQPHSIGVSCERSGNLPGEHEVTFTSDQEQIKINHTVFHRAIFAEGALRILEWMMRVTPKPGLYTMHDIFLSQEIRGAGT
jgi:4-hydroxy-tetrahydrodipicolinate reductase